MQLLNVLKPKLADRYMVMIALFIIITVTAIFGIWQYYDTQISELEQSIKTQGLNVRK